MPKCSWFWWFFTFKPVFLHKYMVDYLHQAVFCLLRRIVAKNNEFRSIIEILKKIFTIIKPDFWTRASPKSFNWFLCPRSSSKTFYFCWNIQLKTCNFHLRDEILMNQKWPTFLLVLTSLDIQTQICSDRTASLFHGCVNWWLSTWGSLFISNHQEVCPPHFNWGPGRAKMLLELICFDI